jgi:hypothetical protein
MAKLYDFLLDSNPMGIIKSYEKTIERLVRQTTECAYFITEYRKISNPGKSFPWGVALRGLTDLP